jgi:hypothetical protein
MTLQPAAIQRRSRVSAFVPSRIREWRFKAHDGSACNGAWDRSMRCHRVRWIASFGAIDTAGRFDNPSLIGAMRDSIDNGRKIHGTLRNKCAL